MIKNSSLIQMRYLAWAFLFLLIFCGEVRADASPPTETGATEVSSEHDAPKKQRSLFFNLGLGLSHLGYSQTREASYSSNSLTPKISARYALAPKWDLGFSAYYTAFNLTKSPAIDARFLGINFRFGHVLTDPGAKWRLTLLTGFYYATMTVTGNKFGFSGQSGPQLFPVLQYRLNLEESIMGYLKFSPVAKQFSLLSMSNREIAGGGAYAYLLESGKSLAYTLDFANIALEIDAVKISTTSITLGIAYGF